MATAHTPGPWTAKGSSIFAGKDCIGVCDTDNAPADRMDANARLMAAAPDMLATLKDVAGMLPCAGRLHPDDMRNLQAAVVAAVAKAEG